MTTSMTLPDKDYRESVVVLFDFSDEATAITGTPVVTSAVFNGNKVDAAAGAMVSGAASIVGATVLQRIAAGVATNDYALACVATSSTGDVLVRAAILPVRALPY